jgi:predicted ATP-grasp superfamily ATP-dependent carboligase
MYVLHDASAVPAPVLVVRLEGWIDAGFAAAAAANALVQQLATEPLATFDADQLLDHRSRRPTMHLSDGVNLGLTWPSIELRVGRDRADHGVLLLVGVEPDHRWPTFAEAVVDLAVRLEVRLVVALGAFPTTVPHTRPTLLAATAIDRELADRVGFVPGRIDVPAGVHAAIEDRCRTAGIPAVGLWARVPHYVATSAYPAAAAALVDGLGELAGLALDSGELHRAAQVVRNRIDEAVAANEQHQALVHQLELAYDRDLVGGEGVTNLGQATAELPSGDELAAELERFLRQQTGE